MWLPNLVRATLSLPRQRLGRPLLLTFFIGLAVMTGSAEGVVFMDSINPNATEASYLTSGFRGGYSFRVNASGTWLEKVTVRFYCQTAGASTPVSLHLYSDSNGQPGSILRSGTLSSGSMTVGQEKEVTVPLSSPIVLSNGGRYWIIVPDWGTGHAIMAGSAANQTYRNEPTAIDFALSSNGGASWTTEDDTLTWGMRMEGFTAPSATTSNATVQAHSATLQGTVDARGSTTTVVFRYGPTGTEFTVSGGTVASSITAGLSAGVIGLAPGTVYYFRIEATNAAGTTTTTLRAFTTAQGERLDPTFSGNGIEATPVGSGHDYGRAVAQAPDGDFIVVGDVTESNGNVGVARYTPAGALRASFAGDGTDTFSFRGGANDFARAVVVQSDGMVVVAGATYDLATNRYDWGLFRYQAGTNASDPSFGTLGNGVVLLDLGGAANLEEMCQALVLQSDGKILAAGVSGGDFAIVRLNANGTLDPSFDGDGILKVDFGGTYDVATDVAIQADGKIVVVGSREVGGQGADTALVRLNTNGSLDSTFGSGGKLVHSFSPGINIDSATDVAIHPDGRIVAAIFWTDGSNPRFAAARWSPDGSLDPTFGNGAGWVTTDIRSGSEVPTAVTLQPDGKILLTGYSYDSAAGDHDVAIVRYHTNGALDTSWGGDGIVITASGPNDDIASDAILTADHKLVVAGYLRNATNYDFSILRYTLAPFTTPLEAWRQEHFGTMVNSGNAADSADPNANGLNNLLEYALGGDPLSQTTGGNVTPQAGVSGGQTLQLSFNRDTTRTDLTLTVVAADDVAGPWTPIARSVAGAPFSILVAPATAPEMDLGNALRAVTVTDLFQMNDPAHTKRFMKLEVLR